MLTQSIGFDSRTSTIDGQLDVVIIGVALFCLHIGLVCILFVIYYDQITKFPTLFWFGVFINKYTPGVSIQKKRSRDAKFGQCIHLQVSVCYVQNRCAVVYIVKQSNT